MLQSAPRVVKFLQNSEYTIVGRLAEAAMLNAHPTRKLTFIRENAMPSPMATTPTKSAAIFAARTFWNSSIGMRR
jgi:hypothetical protein